MKNAFDGLSCSVDWAQLRKKTVTLKIYQYKLSKLKCKEKKEKNIQERWDNYKKYNIHIGRIPLK